MCGKRLTFLYTSPYQHVDKEVLLAQFSLYLHKSGLKPESFFINMLNITFEVARSDSCVF